MTEGQKLNTCFPVSPDSDTAPACQYALRALFFPGNFYPHSLYTFVYCEHNHRIGGYDFSDGDLLENAAFDEI